MQSFTTTAKSFWLLAFFLLFSSTTIKNNKQLIIINGPHVIKSITVPSLRAYMWMVNGMSPSYNSPEVDFLVR